MTIQVTQARVLRSEWTKLRTQRSAAWALLSTLAAIVGFGLLYSLVRVTRPPHTPDAVASFDPTAISLAGVDLAQLAIGVLGVLLISNEYATGMIRATLAAVPGRLPVLWGKAAVMVLTTIVACVPATAAAFLVGQSVLAREHLDIAFGHPGVARAVIGGGLYLGVVGLLGLGLGALIRNTAGAISTLLGALFGLQLVVGLLPGGMQDHVYKYLPSPAGLAVTAVQPDSDALAPWTGLGVMCGYAVVVLAVAAYRMRRSDA
jgi:ABC-type transport system involved in multi-copper enzyme maturation permease subunit